MMRLARLSRTAAIVVLALTAALHLSGLPWAQQASEVEALTPFMQAAMVPLWLFASIHWLVLATILAILPRQLGMAYRITVALGALVVLLDAGLLFGYVGPFVGGYALAAVGLLLILSVLPTDKAVGA